MMRRHAIRIVLGAVLSAAPAMADVVTDWSNVTLDAVRVDRSPPPRAARTLALVHVAMFDAINAIERTREPYLDVGFDAPASASREAAATGAAQTVLLALFPAQAERLNNAADTALAALPDDADRQAGLTLGQAVGAALLAARANDGAANVVAYTPGSAPGDWIPTPPAFAAAVLPQWGSVKPFCLTDVATVRRPGPPELTSAEYTTAFNETKRLGAKVGSVRTPEQTLIAQFWVDGPGTVTPPGHWFQIAHRIAADRGNSLAENARLLALLGLAEADAAICAWDNKYVYSDWRPVTAIRAADADGNPDTAADPVWEPLIPTPAFPSYVSGHSTFSGAGAKILALFYGTDEVAFSTSSDASPGLTRSFTRLSQAANEAGRSRIYGGIHWEYDNQDGLASGRELALVVYDNFLRPVAPVSDGVAPPPAGLNCGPLGVLPLGLITLGIAAMRRR